MRKKSNNLESLTEIHNIISRREVNDLPYHKHEYLLINTKDLNDIFTDKLKLIVIELEKFQSLPTDLNNKEHLYLTFFDKNISHKKRKELGKMDEGLKLAVKKIEEALQDDNAVRIYHKLAWEEMVSENKERLIQEKIEEGREEGMEKGIEKGEENRNIKIATRMKNVGIPVKTIAKCTDLSKEFIEKL